MSVDAGNVFDKELYTEAREYARTFADGGLVPVPTDTCASVGCRTNVWFDGAFCLAHVAKCAFCSCVLLTPSAIHFLRRKNILWDSYVFDTYYAYSMQLSTSINAHYHKVVCSKCFAKPDDEFEPMPAFQHFHCGRSVPMLIIRCEIGAKNRQRTVWLEFVCDCVKCRHCSVPLVVHARQRAVAAVVGGEVFCTDCVGLNSLIHQDLAKCGRNHNIRISGFEMCTQHLCTSECELDKRVWTSVCRYCNKWALLDQERMQDVTDGQFAHVACLKRIIEAGQEHMNTPEICLAAVQQDAKALKYLQD